MFQKLGQRPVYTGSGVLLQAGNSVAVDVQCHAYARMASPLACNLRMDTLAQQVGDVRMAKRMQGDVAKAVPLGNARKGLREITRTLCFAIVRPSEHKAGWTRTSSLMNS